MSRARTIRTWHRRLSLVVGVQLLLWTASGLVFTLDPIEVVRGETLLRPAPAPSSLALREVVPVADAADAAGLATALAGSPDDDTARLGPPGDGATDGRLASARLVPRRGRWTWELEAADGTSRLVDAAGGTVLEPVDAGQAAALARSRFVPRAEVVDVRWIDAAAGEYRGKPVPAWRVRFDDADHSHVYLDAATGEITTVRTDRWRRFDLFWGLHIMSWQDREDFSTWWLTGAAILGVATSATGLALLVSVLVRRRRRGPPAGDRSPTG